MLTLWTSLALLAAAPAPTKAAPDGGVLPLAVPKPIKKLNVVEFKAALKRARESGKFTLVDIREPNETVRGALPGAALLPFASGVFAREHLKISRERPVLIYGASGRPATQAGEMLSREGWKDVSVLYNGGYADLKK
jgi:rhodanese-related sulfurtransferase